MDMGHTTAVQTLEVIRLQIQAILCMNQGIAKVLQVDVHLCEVAQGGDMCGAFSQALLIQSLSFCVILGPDTNIVLVQVQHL